MRHFLIAAAILTTLTACNPAQDDSSSPATETGAQEPRAAPGEPQAGVVAGRDNPEPPANERGADGLGRYLDVLPTDTVKAEIAEAAGHDLIRYIAPGDMVTEDFRPNRLNIETGRDGRIERFRCG